MPPDQSIFMQSVASRHNMFPGSVVGGSPNLNIAGMPGMSGPEGALVQMFLEPMLGGMLGPGFIPGQFRQTHNLYDHYRRKMQFQQMQTTMTSAAESDQLQYARLLRGMAATAGVSWNDERERAARMMASDMSKISPMLAQVMPDTFDQMHGVRGSAALMAQNMFSGGRYRVDPVSGMLGMSADSTAQMTREIYDRLYGPGADLTAMKGIGAGRAGQVFDEMSRRGMLPRVLNRDEQLRGLAQQDIAAKGLKGTEVELGKAMDDLRSLSSPQLEMKLRQFEASRIGDRIKNMAGAVAAMKDVFGEMGRPDAPINELIEGLQVITQGGLATMTPDRIEALVRDTANVARRSGMGMDNMTMLMATSAQRADAMGLDRVFGVTAGMQAGAFGSAYANTYGGMPAWGRADKERMIAVDSQLRLNAANSNVANQLAATVRVGSDVGFKAGSEAAALYDAIQRGDTTYEFGGKKLSVYADPGRWREMMGEAGVDLSLAAMYRSQTAYNQKYVNENNLTDLTRRLQADVDVAPRLSQAFWQAGQAAGITDSGVLGKLGEAAAAGMLGDISPDDLQNPDKVAEYLADKLGVDRGDKAKMDQLRRTATLGWGNIEQLVKRNPRLRGYKSADQLIAAHRRSTTTETQNQIEEAQQESRLQSALSGLGSGGPLERLVDAVAGATPGTSTREIIAKTIGWVPEDEAGAKLETTVKAMEAEIRRFRDTDPEKVGREAKDLDKAIKEKAAKLAAVSSVDRTDPTARAEAKRLRDQILARQTAEANAPETLKQIAKEKYGIADEETIRKVLTGEGLTDDQLGRLKTASDAVKGGAAANEADMARLDELAKAHGGMTALMGDPSPELVAKARELKTKGYNDAVQRLANEQTGGDVEVLLGNKKAAPAGPEAAALNEAIAGDKKKLQELADKYTGGDVNVLLTSKNLKRTIRETTLKKIKAMSPELRRQAEAAGLELGAAASTGDAAKAWASLRDRRASGLVETDVLAEKMLHDDRSMGVLGADGLTLVGRIQDRNRQLREIADKSAGGDMGVLMSSADQRSKAREAYNEVNTGSVEAKRLEEEIRAAEDRGDLETANKKRGELEIVGKRITENQNRLNALGGEVGTTGEKLAQAGEIDPRARAQAEALLVAQMKDVQDVQERLRAGKKEELTADQKKALADERKMRGRTDTEVMDDIVKTLGLGGQVSAEDRAAVAAGALRGDRAFSIRQAVPALQQLREMKKGLSDEQFREYLKKGPGADATDEEKRLYHRVSGGKTGGGLAGLEPGREKIAERLRDFNPDQKDPAASSSRDVKKTAGGKEVQVIEGTITIVGLGEGRLNARGSRT